MFTFLSLLLLPVQVLSLPQTAPSTTPSASSQYTSDEIFTSAILNSTNTYRTQHAASNLTYNSTLSDFATSYLSSQEEKCRFAHSGGPYGENLAIGYADVVASIDGWGGERVDYDFDKGEFSEETGHFTQLVWKNTTAVGCGRVDCGEGKGWYLVCEYWPRGNVIGQFEVNVGRAVEGVDIGSAAGRVGVGRWMVKWLFVVVIVVACGLL